MLVHVQPSTGHVDNCYVCVKSKINMDHPNGEEHFGAHPHNTDETEDDCDCPSTIDVDYRFFDPGRDIDLVKWYADRILHSDRPKCRVTADDEDDEVIAERDINMFCTKSI
ncbi:unnamed protein product [Urochloa humidicola]